MPTLRQLEYLVAVADTRHFRRAAERVHTTQPTLSEQLKALETRLGAQLVERTRSRVVLTPIGTQVVDIARRMLRDAQDIRNVAASSGRGLAGILRLGMSPTIGPYVLPRVVPDLRKRWPGLKLYVREEPPGQLVRLLDEGSLDLVLAPLPVRGADLASEALFREPLYVTVPSDHPLARQRSVDRSELAGQEVLTLGAAYQLHDFVHALCEELGAHVRLDYEGTSLDTLREMVAMGLGITFLPALYVRSVVSRDPSITALEIQGRSIYRSIGMLWRRASARSQHYESLAGLVRDLIEAELSRPFARANVAA